MTETKLNKGEALYVNSMYSIMFVNDLACEAVSSSATSYVISGMCKHNTKRLLNMIDKERSSYIRSMHRTIGDEHKDFFYAANDRFIDKVSHNLDVLYYSIKRVLDKNKVINSKQTSMFMYAYTLCEYACKHHDALIRELSKTDKVLAEKIYDAGIYIGGVYGKMGLMSRNIKIGTDVGTVNLNDDSDCLSAYRIIDGLCTDGRIIYEAIHNQPYPNDMDNQ